MFIIFLCLQVWCRFQRHHNGNAPGTVACAQKTAHSKKCHTIRNCYLLSLFQLRNTDPIIDILHSLRLSLYLHLISPSMSCHSIEEQERQVYKNISTTSIIKNVYHQHVIDFSHLGIFVCTFKGHYCFITSLHLSKIVIALCWVKADIKLTQKKVTRDALLHHDTQCFRCVRHSLVPLCWTGRDLNVGNAISLIAYRKLDTNAQI